MYVHSSSEIVRRMCELNEVNSVQSEGENLQVGVIVSKGDKTNLYSTLKN